MSGETQKSVVIVGAGLAGLCAARLLHKYGVSVQVLEAKDRVGGRTYTKDGFDLGGTFVGDDKWRSLYMAEQLNVKKVPVYKEGLTTFSIEGDISHINNSIPDCKVLGLFGLLALLRAMYTINSKGKQIDPKAPWNAPSAEKWDHMTTDEWIRSETTLPKPRALLRFIVQVLLGVEPSEISFLYFLWYILVGSGMPGILTHAQDYVFEGGSQQISEKIVAELGNDRVHLSNQVVRIDLGSDDHVTVATSANQQFKCQYCILAVTPGVRNLINFEPNLNGLYHQFPQRMPMGSMVKTFAIYDKPWWREKGYNGMATITDQSSYVGQTFDITLPGQSSYCIMGFILGKRARLWQQIEQEDRKNIVLQEYARVFETDEALNVKNYFEKDWLSDVFIGGSGGVAACGVTTTFRQAIREPVDR